MKTHKALICCLAFTLPALLVIYCGSPTGTEKAESEEKAAKEDEDEGGEMRGDVEENQSTAQSSWMGAFRIGAQEEITNSVGMRLRLIPAGSFMMGAVPGDGEADADEKPQRRVEITKAFYIGVYEVTQAQWQAVMSTNPSNFKGSSRPLERVYWNDAVEFCRKLSNMTGENYRLPTEAEWEYACRAGTTTKYYWGNSTDGNYAWYDNNSGGETHEVGRKSPNAWDLYDMSGNVWEWCSDWYDSYSGSTQTDPTGPSSGYVRVLRGGSWLNFARYIRSSIRNYGYPDSRSSDIGFRIVRDVE